MMFTFKGKEENQTKYTHFQEWGGDTVAEHLPRHSKVKGSSPSSAGIGVENGEKRLNPVLVQRENSHHKENEL
jgi:hypothetical protein